MYLHNHNDIPLVWDLGFAVEPGKHALVAVEQHKVSRKYTNIYNSFEKQLTVNSNLHRADIDVSLSTKRLADKSVSIAYIESSGSLILIMNWFCLTQSDLQAVSDYMEILCQLSAYNYDLELRL